MCCLVFRLALSALKYLLLTGHLLPCQPIPVFVCFPVVYLYLEAAILASCPANLRSKNPIAVNVGLRDLQWAMSQEFAKKVVEKGLIPDLVALIEPGADASMWRLFQGAEARER